MAAVPEREHSTAAAIFAAWEARADREERPHLGASQIGHACERHLWLAFRWALPRVWPGRMLRLFDHGKREEVRIVEDLCAIGCEVSEGPRHGEQWRVADCGGHFGGSLDAAVRGLPEAPTTWHVGEWKTHNDKSFAELVKHQVAKAMPLHWAQMQVYMGLTGMKRALYVAVNKNTDALHIERVEFDPVEFARLKTRAERVIFAAEPPDRVSADPAWYGCKLCHFHELCHGTAAPAVSCRTCVHASPERTGEARWSCAWHRRDLSVAEQRAACDEHRHFPILLGRFAELVAAGAEDNSVRYRNLLTGNVFGQPEYASAEIAAAQDKRLLGDPGANKLRALFDGRVVA